MKASLGLLAALVAVTLGWGMGLPQSNPDEIFLTDSAKESFRRDRHAFGGVEPLIASQLSPLDPVQDMIDQVGGAVARLPDDPSGAVFTLPPMDEARLKEFFKQASMRSPQVRFAGAAYTNAQLAIMSDRIQRQLMPMLFAVVFVAAWVLLKNFRASLYLFLTSLLGVGIGLSTVRLLYGSSNILTTLTPLVSFILALGMQLHVLYGLSLTKPALFWKEKSWPLLLTAGTTLVGFYSLATSDIVCVRQLAVSMGTSLALTWCINLLIAHRWPPVFALRFVDWRATGGMMRARPVLGYGIIAVSSLAGALAIASMRTMVEAVYFFPEGHLVREGVERAVNLVGGTPQAEVLIKRADGRAWSYEDTRKIAAFEHSHGLAPGVRLLSVTALLSEGMIKQIGKAEFPELESDFKELLQLLPTVMRQTLQVPEGHKWVLIARPMANRQRDQFEGTVHSYVEGLPAAYKAQVGGISHWLVSSQRGLVTSLLKSFALSLLLIVLSFAAINRSPRQILNFATLNAASVAGGFALMWALGFEFNVSVVMTASISLGLVVDSTIHLMFSKAADATSLRSTYHAIVISHLVLFVGFMALAFEEFVPIRDFSLGLLLLLGVGLVFDLWVLPMIEEDVGR